MTQERFNAIQESRQIFVMSSARSLRPRIVLVVLPFTMLLAACGLSITTNSDQVPASASAEPSSAPAEPSSAAPSAAVVEDAVLETNETRVVDSGIQVPGAGFDGPGEVPELSSTWDPRQIALTNENDRSSSAGALCWAVREITRLEHLLFVEHLIADGLYAPPGSNQGHVGTTGQGTPSEPTPGSGVLDPILADSGESMTTGGDSNTAVDAAVTAVRDAALLVSGSDYRALINESTLPDDVAVFASEFFAAAEIMANSESYMETNIEALTNSSAFSDLVSDSEDCVFPEG